MANNDGLLHMVYFQLNKFLPCKESMMSYWLIYIYPLFKPRVVINEVPSTRLLLEMAVLQETAVHTMVM